jgi:hypothetical protein
MSNSAPTSEKTYLKHKYPSANSVLGNDSRLLSEPYEAQRHILSKTKSFGLLKHVVPMYFKLFKYSGD